MFNFNAFKIYKKELNWKAEGSEDSTFTVLGAVKSEDEAELIVSKLSEANDRVDISYGYKEVSLNLFENVEDFFTYNFKDKILE